MTHDEEIELLSLWTRRLTEALDIDGVTVDIDAVLGLAGEAAHAVMRPAAPLTTFVVGFAAGLASADDGVTVDEAIAQATTVARALCRDEAAHASPVEATE
jgi:Domain of unknown function (DUF6457)